MLDNLVEGKGILIEKRYGQEAMRYQPVGFEEVQIKHYIQNQEQLDGKGSDEDGEF